MVFKTLIRTLLCALVVTSCSPVRNITYFQDVEHKVGTQLASEQTIKFKPDDKVSIIVNTKDELLDKLFNLAVATKTIGSTSSSGQGNVAAYTVNPDGYIDFPVLGPILVEGKSRHELSQYVKKELIDQQLVSDPIVTVEYSGLYVTVLGEVSGPGRYNIERDKITITEALSMAGDLTIYGKRENITVFRQEGDMQVPYVVNLLSMEELYGSPVYYLQQNDMIYVEPNDMRTRQSTVNGNNLLSTSFWISLTSLLVSIANFIF